MNNSEPIKSRDNARLAALRKVRDGYDRTRVFIEGKRLVDEALRSSLDIAECFIDEDRIERDLIKRVADSGAIVHRVAAAVFPSIADTKSPQGIVLTAARPKWDMADLLDKREEAKPIVYLTEVNNPANLGALLRTAEASGVGGVIVSSRSADAYSPKALRASMGSAFRVKVVEAVDLAQAIEWFGQLGLAPIALDVSGSMSYSEVNWNEPRLIVFGSEATGLSENDLAMVREKVIIPMENGVESLNLAVSAGVVLFEAKRQRLSGLR